MTQTTTKPRKPRDPLASFFRQTDAMRADRFASILSGDTTHTPSVTCKRGRHSRSCSIQRPMGVAVTRKGLPQPFTALSMGREPGEGEPFTYGREVR